MQKIVILDINFTCTLSMRRKLIISLQENGYEVITFATGSRENIENAKNIGFNVIDIGTSVQNPIHILQYLLRLKKELKRSQADVCLTFTIRPAIWGNIITRILGIPTITNITGIGPLFERNNIAYKGARLLYKFVLSKTAKIFFQNEDDMQIFLDHNFVTKERVIKVPGSGVDFNYFTPREKLTNSTKFQFVFISRLVKDKGIMEFLECAKQLQREYADIECLIIGPFWNQNLKDNTITEAELNWWVDQGIVIYGGEQQDVRPFIANADCVVLPSYREGTSNVLLEACSMERPCITSNVTGCKEVIVDNYNGFLCNARSTNSLFDAMKKMYFLAKPERIKMGKNGRLKMMKEFDKQIVVDAYLKAIKEVIKCN